MPDISKHSSLTDLAAFAAGMDNSALQKQAGELRSLAGENVAEGFSPPSESWNPKGFRYTVGKATTNQTLAFDLKNAWAEIYGPTVTSWPQNLQEALSSIETGLGLRSFNSNLISAFQNLRLEYDTAAAFEAGIAVVAQFIGQNGPMNRATTELAEQALQLQNAAQSSFIPEEAAQAGLGFVKSPFALFVPIVAAGIAGRATSALVANAGRSLSLANEAIFGIASALGLIGESAAFVATSDVVARFIGPNDGPINGATTFLEETFSSALFFGGLKAVNAGARFAALLLPAGKTGVAAAKFIGHAGAIGGLAVTESVQEEMGSSVVAQFIGQNSGPINRATTFYTKLWRAAFLHATVQSTLGIINLRGVQSEAEKVAAEARSFFKTLQDVFSPVMQASTGKGINLDMPVRAASEGSGEGTTLPKNINKLLKTRQEITASKRAALNGDIFLQAVVEDANLPQFVREAIAAIQNSWNVYEVEFYAMRALEAIEKADASVMEPLMARYRSSAANTGAALNNLIVMTALVRASEFIEKTLGSETPDHAQYFGAHYVEKALADRLKPISRTASEEEFERTAVDIPPEVAVNELENDWLSQRLLRERSPQLIAETVGKLKNAFTIEEVKEVIDSTLGSLAQLVKSGGLKELAKSYTLSEPYMKELLSKAIILSGRERLLQMLKEILTFNIAETVKDEVMGILKGFDMRLDRIKRFLAIVDSWTTKALRTQPPIAGLVDKISKLNDPFVIVEFITDTVKGYPGNFTGMIDLEKLAKDSHIDFRVTDPTQRENVEKAKKYLEESASLNVARLLISTGILQIYRLLERTPELAGTEGGLAALKKIEEQFTPQWMNKPEIPTYPGLEQPTNQKGKYTVDDMQEIEFGESALP